MFPLTRRRLSAATIAQMPTTAQIAAEFGVSCDTVRRWGRFGVLPSIKLAGQWRFGRYWSDWLTREMYRQMYVRQSWRVPDTKNTQPSKEYPQQ